MKKALSFLLVLLPLTVISQSALVTYNGGFFVRENSNTWREYRPGDSEVVWATYTQYGEEKNYYNIRSSECEVSIPKDPHNNIYLYNKSKGKWEVVYYTRNIYNYFSDNARQIYTYSNGYFVRDGNSWREYRPVDKHSTWSYYTQYDEDENFFYIESTTDKVAVPKSSSNNFFLRKNGKWEVVYYTCDIYDATAEYDYVLKYSSYKISAGKSWDVHNAPAYIYLSRKGKVLVCYGDTRNNFSNSPYSFGIPSYISSTGNIYILHFHSGTYGPITSISSLCLKDLSFKYSSIYEVHIGDSLVSVREKVKDRLLDESFNFLLWSDSSGYCICLAPDDCETICSIVRFSEELELLEATGIVPIPAIDLKDQEKWVGKTEAEFIEQYGYCHFDFGSGIYMPNYIAETGEIYWFTVENGVIVRFRSYFVNQ